MNRELAINANLKINGFMCNSGCGAQFHLPIQKIALDAGVLYPGAEDSDFVLISHGHIDHCGALASFILRRLIMLGKQTTVVCPEYMLTPLKDIMHSYRYLQMENAKIHPPLEVIYITVPKDMNYMRLSSSLGVEIFNLEHSPRSIGYGIEYNGENILATVFDTAIGGLVKNIDRLSKYKALLMECTMLGPSEICNAHNHLNLVDINAVLAKKETVGSIEDVVLTHLSPSYTYDDITRKLDSLKDDSFLNNSIRVHYL